MVYTIKCLKCKSNLVKKNGKCNGKQRYLCKECGYVWEIGTKKNLSQQEIEEIIFKYVRYNHIYEDISQNKNLSKHTVWKIVNNFVFDNTYNDNLEPIEDIIYTDTVYIKGLGALTIFNSGYYRKPILWIWSEYETKQTYIEGLRIVEIKGLIIKGVVIDIMRGLKNYLESKNIPVQYCTFHQKMVMRRYLTKNPTLEQNKDLKDIGLCIGKCKLRTIKDWLDDWYKRNKDWLSEKNENGAYTHEKTRKAYRSLKNNLENFYTYEKYPELGFETTNNLSEGINSIIKNKLG